MRTLPERVPLNELLSASAMADGVPVGLEVDELEPLLVDLRDGPNFVVTGPPRGGKSSLLVVWLLALAARYSASDLRLYVADLGHDSLRPLARLPHMRMRIQTDDDFGASYDGVGCAIKEIQTGFLIGGSDFDDLQVLGINLSHPEARQGLAPGRGFYSQRRRFVRVKVADVPTD